jgi:hypothetical protein
MEDLEIGTQINYDWGFTLTQASQVSFEFSGAGFDLSDPEFQPSFELNSVDSQGNLTSVATFQYNPDTNKFFYNFTSASPLAANNYSLIISGIAKTSNTSGNIAISEIPPAALSNTAVPEPAEWIMMLFGLPFVARMVAKRKSAAIV